jgi:hypothetical protein
MKMLRKKVLERQAQKALGFVVVMSLVCGWAGAGELAWYCRPWGSINYRGQPAPDGLKVVAFIQETAFDSCETKYGEYSLAIPKDDPETKEKEGWADGDLITVQVGGYTAVPSFAAFSGKQQINLYLPTLDVKLTTWGKIKGLFR